MNNQPDDNNLFYLVPKKELDRLVRIEEKLDRLLSSGMATPQVNGKHGNWLKEKEVQEMLGIKYGALYKLRIDGKLSFSNVAGKVYYDQREIINLLEKNKRKAFKK